MYEENKSLVICPECGGDMKDHGGDPEMYKCVACGHEISVDEARANDGEESTGEVTEF